MDEAIAKIAEAKIREAMENGEFDNLPGKGKPLRVQDLSAVPEEFRAAYTVLKNSGFLPEELSLRQEIASLRELLRALRPEEDGNELKKQLREKSLRYNLLREKRGRR
jgi:hypothetical protein